MIGRTYLEHGEPVTIVAAYALPSKARPLPACPDWLVWHRPPRSAPHNVLIQRADGTRLVRSFRGLRRHKENTNDAP